VSPNVSDGLRVHAILFSQCSAAHAHEFGILRALRVNFLRLHHHITERKHLKSVCVEFFFPPYLMFFCTTLPHLLLWDNINICINISESIYA
jgi:hypothetical protein